MGNKTEKSESLYKLLQNQIKERLNLYVIDSQNFWILDPKKNEIIYIKSFDG